MAYRLLGIPDELRLELEQNGATEEAARLIIQAAVQQAQAETDSAIREIQAIVGPHGSLSHVQAGGVQISPGIGVGIFADGVQKTHIHPRGHFFIGSDLESPETTTEAFFVEDFVYNGEEFEPGDFLIGNNSDGHGNLKWDASEEQLQFRGGTTITAYMDADGTMKFLTGTIGGWSITATTIENLTDNVGISMDASDPAFYIGNLNGLHGVIDGAENAIYSSDYVAGQSGGRWDFATSTFEINNIIARGVIKTAVFERDAISAVGGSLMVLPSIELGLDMGASNGAHMFLADNILAIGEVLRMKGDGDDEWIIIEDVDPPDPLAENMWRYSLLRDRNDDYPDNQNPQWKKGQAVVRYGPAGGGGVELTAGESPYIRVFDHTGSPWTTIREIIRLDEGGMHVANEAAKIDFLNAAGDNAVTQIYGDSNEELTIISRVAGKAINWTVTLQDDSTPYLRWGEHPDDDNVSLLQINAGSEPTVVEIAGGLVRFDTRTATKSVNFFSEMIYDAGAEHRLEIGQDHYFPTRDASNPNGFWNEANQDMDFTFESVNQSEVSKMDAGLDKYTSLIWDGWGKRDETWTRTGNHTFTVSGDVTAIYRPGTKVRYNDGATDYGVIASSSHAGGTTTVNLIRNSDYAMAAATINDRYISYIENPEGFPSQFNYSPATNLGNAVLSSITTATWSVTGRTLHLNITADNKSLSGSAGFIGIALPCTASVTNGWWPLSVYFISSYEIVRTDQGVSQLNIYKGMTSQSWAGNETGLYLRIKGTIQI